MTVNRIVAFLTPVYAGLSGWVVQWVADHFPGAPTLSKGELTAIFVAGSTAAIGSALTWLHGWQKHEERNS